MAFDIRKFFDDVLPAQFALYSDRARTVETRFQFNISGERGGEWYVDASATGPTVARGSGPADVTITMADADLEVGRGQLIYHPSYWSIYLLRSELRRHYDWEADTIRVWEWRELLRNKVRASNSQSLAEIGRKLEQLFTLQVDSVPGTTGAVDLEVIARAGDPALRISVSDSKAAIQLEFDRTACKHLEAAVASTDGVLRRFRQQVLASQQDDMAEQSGMATDTARHDLMFEVKRVNREARIRVIAVEHGTRKKIPRCASFSEAQFGVLMGVVLRNMRLMQSVVADLEKANRWSAWDDRPEPSEIRDSWHPEPEQPPVVRGGPGGRASDGDVQQIIDLLNLAGHESTYPEEGRNAAVEAARRILKYGLKVGY